MTYPEVIRYLESFINYEKIPAYPYKESLKLERIRGFLDSVGNPQNSLKCIHIAGTKGKGSTCAFIAYILKQAGFKVGLYTSPHLSDFRERIRILHQVPKQSGSRCPISWTPGARLAGHQVQDEFEGMITQQDLAGLVQRFKPGIDKFNAASEYGPLTFFEVYTALAFIYFKERKVDFAVLETGLGGRLDATNTVNPLAVAITPLSFEHTDKLGKTLKEIAAEKAGIIKSRRPSPVVRRPLIVITAPQEPEALGVIRDKCKEVGAKLYEVGKDITYQKIKDSFTIKGILGAYPDLEIRLLGEHQLINACVAVGVIESLRTYNIGIEVVREGLKNTLWPGRCEVVSQDPLVVLDGAQNIASAEALKEAVKENFQYQDLTLVLGISSDKDIEGICSALSDLAARIILTQADNPRAVDPQDLARNFDGQDIHITHNVSDAKALAKRISKKEDLILVTGSLFVVGEYRND